MEQLQRHMTNGLLNPHIWGNICALGKLFLIYDFATAPL